MQTVSVDTVIEGGELIVRWEGDEALTITDVMMMAARFFPEDWLINVEISSYESASGGPPIMRMSRKKL